MKITEQNREQLIADYADRILDDMDHKTMSRIIYDMLVDEKETYTNEELETEIMDYYPDLLREEDET